MPTRMAQEPPSWTAWANDEAVPTLRLLSVLVLGEIRKGVELARPRDPVKAAALERWLDAVSHAFTQRILPIDHAVANAWGRLNAPHPRPSVDSLLAATAQVYDLTLVTRNVADVKHAGIKLLNPFVPA